MALLNPGEECEPGISPFSPDGQYCDDQCLCVGCGNGRVDEGESCDYTAEPTGCVEDEYTYCASDCECVSARPDPFCGDAVINLDEECEPRVEPSCPDGQYCSDECFCVGCGNGRIDDGEQCDYEAEPTGCDGNGYCSSYCSCVVGAPTERPTGPPAVDEYCGDGTLEDGEECESGVPPHCPDGQFCDEYCQCNGCGNGRVDEGEACDHTAYPNGCPEGVYCNGDCLCLRSEPTETPSPSSPPPNQFE